MIRNIRPVLLCLCVLTVVYAVAQDEPKLVKINDSISMAMMASNVYLVTTPDGNAVIDTSSGETGGHRQTTPIDSQSCASEVHHLDPRPR